LVAIVRFRDNKLAHEHIYWDQASLLVQLGLLDPNTFTGRRYRDRAEGCR
jgi:carboxymethylenebutenolidase